MKIKKKYVKNPVVLGIGFIVLLFIAGYLIPNSIPGAAFLEIILACFGIAFVYVKLANENFEKKQRLGMAIAFCIFGGLSTAVLLKTGTVEVQAESISPGVLLILFAFLAVISLGVYFFLWTAGTLAYSHLKKRK